MPIFAILCYVDFVLQRIFLLFYFPLSSYRQIRCNIIETLIPTIEGITFSCRIRRSRSNLTLLNSFCLQGFTLAINKRHNECLYWSSFLDCKRCIIFYLNDTIARKSSNVIYRTTFCNNLCINCNRCIFSQLSNIYIKFRLIVCAC